MPYQTSSRFRAPGTPQERCQWTIVKTKLDTRAWELTDEDIRTIGMYDPVLGKQARFSRSLDLQFRRERGRKKLQAQIAISRARHEQRIPLTWESYQQLGGRVIEERLEAIESRVGPPDPTRGRSLAFALCQMKSVNDAERVVTGIASDISADRLGDVVEPRGVVFTLPLPFLWQHHPDQPIGQVIAANVTGQGIHIRAKVANDIVPRIAEAWALIRAGLVNGLSVGFRALKSERIPGSSGMRILSWELLEVSCVTIPANPRTTITDVKLASRQQLADTRQHRPSSPTVATR